MNASDVVGNHGEVVVARSGGMEMNTEKLRAKAQDVCEISSRSWFKFWHKCGHFDSWSCSVNLHGLEFDPYSKWRECPECFFKSLKAKAIRCAVCTLPIVPGDPVALYDAESKAVIKEHAKILDGSAVGCLRWDCCPSGGFYCGNWDGEKIISPWDKSK
jgi:hypothetical protein